MWPICAWEPFVLLNKNKRGESEGPKAEVKSDSMTNYWTFLALFFASRARLIRVVIPVGMLGMLVVAISGISIYSLHRLQDSMVHAARENAASMSAGLRLLMCVRELMSTYNRYLLTGDEVYLVHVEALKARTEEALAEVGQLALTDMEKINVQELRSGIKTFYLEYSRQLEEKENASFQAVARKMDRIYSEEIQRPSDAYIKLNEDALAQTIEKNARMTVLVNRGITGIGIIGAMVGTITGVVVTMGLVRAHQKAESILQTATDTLKKAVTLEAPPGDDVPKGEVDYREMAQKVIARLKKSELDALRAEKLAYLGQMAAGVAHEIRNPLMTVKLLVQNATMESGDSRIDREDLAILEDEILRMEKIISGFLDFARPDPPRQRPCPIGELLERSVGSLQLRANIQSVSIILRNPVPDRLLVVDPDQVSQAVLNLVINSLDALPEGGEIVVECSVAAREGVFSIRFSDTGPGICEEIAPALFEPFTSSKASGLGLGLSIARRIIEGHGGSLVLDKVKESAGAAFIMSFPMR